MDCGMGSSAIEQGGWRCILKSTSSDMGSLRTCQRVKTEGDANGIEFIALQEVEEPMVVIGP